MVLSKVEQEYTAIQNPNIKGREKMNYLKNKKILILSNHFITLYNFRKELIQKLVDSGHEVFISIPKSPDNEIFKNMGCKIINTTIDRRGINPLTDLKLIVNYIKIILKVKPNIILSYTIKPNIYGSIASNITKYKQVNNITGTGATFIENNLISKIAKKLYQISIKNSYKVFFQNSGDSVFFVSNDMVNDNYELLPGSGVNLQQYKLSKLPKDDKVNFIFIGRIMQLKGIEEYLEAAKRVKKQYSQVSFYIAGFIEEKKYKEIIDDYVSKGIVTYLGFQKDIKSWIEKCHCTILPSHGGEGIPNVLLESAAMGRICIASDVNGSTDVIDDNITGYIFKPGSSEDLTDKVKRFLSLTYEEKVQMGLNGRNSIEQNFDRNIVIDKYIQIIEEI